MRALLGVLSVLFGLLGGAVFLSTTGVATVQGGILMIIAAILFAAFAIMGSIERLRAALTPPESSPPSD